MYLKEGNIIYEINILGQTKIKQYVSLDKKIQLSSSDILTREDSSKYVEVTAMPFQLLIADNGELQCDKTYDLAKITFKIADITKDITVIDGKAVCEFDMPLTGELKIETYNLDYTNDSLAIITS